MLVLVSYDVNTEDAAGRRRLRRIARHCGNWGQRVQFSVFECVVDPAQWKRLRAALLNGAGKAILGGKQLVQIAIGAPERLVDGERLAAFFHGAADVPQQLC